MSSLRDPHTGTYIHHGMALSIGAQTHAVLLQSHKDIFADWLSLSFEEQLDDLKAFVRSVRLPPRSGSFNRKGKMRIVLDTWTKLQPYRLFVPLSVPNFQLDLFQVNLQTLLALAKSESDKAEHSKAAVVENLAQDQGEV